MLGGREWTIAPGVSRCVRFGLWRWIYGGRDSVAGPLSNTGADLLQSTRRLVRLVVYRNRRSKTSLGSPSPSIGKRSTRPLVSPLILIIIIILIINVASRERRLQSGAGLRLRLGLRLHVSPAKPRRVFARLRFGRRAFALARIFARLYRAG